MRILLIGAYGFIGTGIARRLKSEHAIRAMGRDIAIGERLLPDLEWVHGDLNRMTRQADWLPLLEGIDAVINASGALQSGGGDRLASIQQDSICALIDACESAGIQRFVQISAISATIDDASEFMRTKALADTRLAESDLNWAILRPALVIGRDAYGGTMLLRSLAAQPLAMFLVHGERPVQTVALCDITEAVAKCLTPTAARRVDAVLAECNASTLRDVILQHRSWLGISPPRATINLAASFARPVSLIADALGALGWRSPLRSTALAMISRGVTGDPATGEALLGRPLSSLSQTLAANPAGSQDRWQARLTLLMPLIIGSLALLWLGSGIVGIARLDAVIAELGGTRISKSMARLLGLAGSMADIALGLAILVRPCARATALGMACLTIIYLLSGSIFRPDMWLDPLAPLIKAIPAMVLALVAAGILERR